MAVFTIINNSVLNTFGHTDQNISRNILLKTDVTGSVSGLMKQTDKNFILQNIFHFIPISLYFYSSMKLLYMVYFYKSNCHLLLITLYFQTYFFIPVNLCWAILFYWQFLFQFQHCLMSSSVSQISVFKIKFKSSFHLQKDEML